MTQKPIFLINKHLGLEILKIFFPNNYGLAIILNVRTNRFSVAIIDSFTKGITTVVNEETKEIGEYHVFDVSENYIKRLSKEVRKFPKISLSDMFTAFIKLQGGINGNS